MTTAAARKQRSIEILKQNKVPYMEHLPQIETADTVKIRTTEEVAKRLLACLITIQYACDLAADYEDLEESKAFVQGLLEKYEVESCITEKEKALFAGTATQQDALNMTWKYEACQALLWALGFVEELEYPSEICDCEFAIQTVSSCDTFQEFLQSCKLRGIEEILDEADLIFRYDWACVNARLKGQEAPASLHSGIVMERHWGLNWLIDAYDEDWDNVSTNT